MAMKTKRRLFDILTKEVSLVDNGANNQKFILIKRTGGIEMGKDSKDESLESIEKALNTLGDQFKEVMEALPKQEADESDVTKAGQKFSSGTMSQLKSIHSAIGKLLEGVDLGGGDNKTKKSLTKEEISVAAERGFKDGFTDTKKSNGKVEDELLNKFSAEIAKQLGVIASSALSSKN